MNNASELPTKTITISIELSAAEESTLDYGILRLAVKRKYHEDLHIESSPQPQAI